MPLTPFVPSEVEGRVQGRELGLLGVHPSML
jgi:hypothetical protein